MAVGDNDIYGFGYGNEDYDFNGVNGNTFGHSKYYSALADRLNDPLNQTLSNLGKGIGIASSLANIYLGFENLGIAKKEFGIKEDKWKLAKEELRHMQNTRSRLTSSYMA